MDEIFLIEDTRFLEHFKDKSFSGFKKSDVIKTLFKSIETGKVEKMSKSKKNVVDPNDIIDTYGADTARWFMLSDSPPDRDLQWTDTGIAASFKFINKIHEFIDRHRKYESKNTSDLEILNDLKQTTNLVAENIEAFQFNKSVAKIYEFVNTLNDAISKQKLSKATFDWSLKKLSIILQPFVPHISEEIWSNLDSEGLCIDQEWNIENVEKKNNLKIAVQINGKTKEVIEVEKGLSKESVLEIVKNNDKIKKNIIGKNIIREIYVPSKIVNLVLS